MIGICEASSTATKSGDAGVEDSPLNWVLTKVFSTFTA